jgi:hypothetical protein
MTNKGYMLTYTGEQVGPHKGVPSLLDIAVGLSRIPRFGGQGRRWWSVLDHSLFCEYLARQIFGCNHQQFRLHALLHDAHEALTGDVPTPLKTKDIRAAQHQLDKRIFAALVPEHEDMWLHDREDIKAVDTYALLAEALVVGPPSIKTLNDVYAHFGAVPLESHVLRLREGMGGMWGNIPTEPAEEYLGVLDFIALYSSLREKPA